MGCKTRWILVLIAMMAGSACAPHRVGEAEAAARRGDFETAVAAYRLALQEHPGDHALAARLAKVQEKLARALLEKGQVAESAGRLGEAGEDWERAVVLASDPALAGEARNAIAEHAEALQSFGEEALRSSRWSEAVAVYGALLQIRPDSLELTERFRDARREYAKELELASDRLSERHLPGAALLAGLKAVQQDPLLPGAYDRVSRLRKTLTGRSRIALNQVSLEDNGYHAFGVALVAPLSGRLDAYPPYGPSRDPEAVSARFVAVVERVQRTETTRKGEDVLPNDLPPVRENVPNPAYVAQEKRVEALEEEEADLRNELAATLPPQKDYQDGDELPAPHAASPDETEHLKGGLEIAHALDAKRQELILARIALRKIAPTVLGPPPPATWTLPWADVTRTITARVRFELHEADSPAPIVLTLSRTVSHTSRTHEGNARQGVLAQPLELPSYETMNQELAGQFLEATGIIEKARARRWARLASLAAAAEPGRDREEVLDGYVESLFVLGPRETPLQAKWAVMREADVEQLKDVLGGPANHSALR